jgi:flavin reductase (DIM6/NTAB) family NADH-FMN oxidoreductase RutF
MRDAALNVEPPRAVAEQAFRDALATVSMPVTVVTTIDGRRPHGTTVSAFSSLSLDPTMVLVSRESTTTLLRRLRRTKRLGVNVLTHDQLALALRFATKAEEKFADVPWSLDAGLPRLRGCTAWAACDAQRFVRGGDHVVVFGLVVAAAHDPLAPLVRHARRFGTAVPL